MDKTKNYEMFYWQNVIKPVLIRMPGARISGALKYVYSIITGHLHNFLLIMD